MGWRQVLLRPSSLQRAIYCWVLFSTAEDCIARAEAAASTRPLALDWFNGCRSPYNNGMLQGAVNGLTIDTDPADLYIAVRSFPSCACFMLTTPLC
jgi:ribulose kinase